MKMHCFVPVVITAVASWAVTANAVDRDGPSRSAPASRMQPRPAPSAQQETAQDNSDLPDIPGLRVPDKMRRANPSQAANVDRFLAVATRDPRYVQLMRDMDQARKQRGARAIQRIAELQPQMRTLVAELTQRAGVTLQSLQPSRPTLEKESIQAMVKSGSPPGISRATAAQLSQANNVGGDSAGDRVLAEAPDVLEFTAFGGNYADISNCPDGYGAIASYPVGAPQKSDSDNSPLPPSSKPAYGVVIDNSFPVDTDDDCDKYVIAATVPVKVPQGKLGMRVELHVPYYFLMAYTETIPFSGADGQASTGIIIHGIDNGTLMRVPADDVEDSSANGGSSSPSHGKNNVYFSTQMTLPPGTYDVGLYARVSGDNSGPAWGQGLARAWTDYMKVTLF